MNLNNLRVKLKTGEEVELVGIQKDIPKKRLLSIIKQCPNEEAAIFRSGSKKREYVKWGDIDLRSIKGER